VGASRKSMIYKSLGISPIEALNGTTVVNTLALKNGADILRVHDVREARETINLYEMYENNAISI
jgi:dihydropteroate synthase